MKKLSLVLAMVLATGMAMAQHVDVVNQTGGDNSATVNQSFNGTGTALNGNQAFIDQIGDRNTADVDQINNGYGGQQHVAKVWSQGDDNYGKIFQDLQGMGNAIEYQYGNKNWANIYEAGNFGAGAPLNPAYDAFSSQIGDQNVVNINIWGTSSTAYAEQVGDKNNISQNLGSGLGLKVENSNFSAQQFGDRNTAIQMMEGDGFAGAIKSLNDNGTIYQQGDDNTAKQSMFKGSGVDANNTAKAYQLGDKNWSEQTQTGPSNSSTHSQIGYSNVAITVQN